jgi:hypothetical protein
MYRLVRTHKLQAIYSVDGFTKLCNIDADVYRPRFVPSISAWGNPSPPNVPEGHYHIYHRIAE